MPLYEERLQFDYISSRLVIISFVLAYYKHLHVPSSTKTSSCREVFAVQIVNYAGTCLWVFFPVHVATIHIALHKPWLVTSTIFCQFSLV